MMAGLIGKIFGSESGFKGAVSALAEGVDKFIYTKEEKAKMAALVSDQYVKWQESTQGQNIARRLIALSITVTWLSMFIARVVFGALDNQFVSGVLGDNLNELTNPVMLILGFYFAGPHLERFVGLSKNRNK